jgi:hypothetical protein
MKIFIVFIFLFVGMAAGNTFAGKVDIHELNRVVKQLQESQVRQAKKLDSRDAEIARLNSVVEQLQVNYEALSKDIWATEITYGARTLLPSPDQGAKLESLNAELSELKNRIETQYQEEWVKEIAASVMDEGVRELEPPYYMMPPDEEVDTGIFLESGFRYVTPRGIDIDVGVVDGKGNDGFVEGTSRGAEFDGVLSSINRLGYRFKDGSTVSGSFWSLKAHESIHLTAPPDGELWNIMQLDDDTNNVSSITGRVRLNLKQFDFDYTRPFLHTKRFNIEGLAGLRYAEIDNNLQITAVDDGSTPNDIETISSDINTRMFGIKFGLRTEYDLFSGLSLYVNPTTSLLLGFTEEEMFQQLADNNIDELIHARSRYEEVHPVYEVDAGFKYNILPDLFLKAGYHFGYWTDAITRKRVSDQDTDGLLIEEKQSLSFDGFSFYLGYTF